MPRRVQSWLPPSLLWGLTVQFAAARATLTVQASGLGLREASAVALPAFLASRIASRPAALRMATHAHDAGLLCIDDFVVRYDERTGAAMTALMADLPPDMHEILRSA
eukprot:5934355-Karenia_brevis.AAC.1